MTGSENPFPEKGALVSTLDAVAEGGSGNALAGTAAVGTADAASTPAGLGIAAAAGAVVTGALLYDLGRTIADTISRALPRRQDDVVPLYRGVPADHPAYTFALLGMAIPLGGINGHDNPGRHNAGDTSSIFTSWTSDPAVAARFAITGGPGGVVLFKEIPRARTVPSPDRFAEREVLVVGGVSGADVRILP